ncbi:MAG: Xaa-Pro dipeptidase [Calditrichaeota bacterium]|nr:Xaa-Pro dipeptidase [Calditrichota bacterium]
MNETSLYKQHIDHLKKAYSEILKNHNVNSLLIHSGMIDYYFLDDRPYSYKVNPHFNYWLPLTNNPNCFLFIEADQTPQLFYYKATDYWHEMAPDPTGFWVDNFKLTVITNENDVKTALNSRLKKSAYIGNYAKQLDWGFQSVNPAELIHETHYLRAVKTPYEQHCMAEANRLAAKSHQAAKDKFFNGGSEFDIHMAYLQTMNRMEYQMPYSNIIAINENAATLHYTNCRSVRFTDDKRHSFLIDAGAEYNGYAADVTRTYSYKDNEFSELIDAMNEKQLQMVNYVSNGVSYTENQLYSHKCISEILADFDFVRLSAEDIYETKISKQFYPHGIGHFLGIQVHDVGGFLKSPKGSQIAAPEDHPFLRLTRTIQAGHVFTIEPGLYFIDSLLAELKESQHSKSVNWEKVDRFRKFGGVRIEDNICMTESDRINFTRDAFKELT